MKILLIGAGVVGLGAAVALQRRGHEVEVLEAADAVGTGTSFANGGILTPSMPDPWNAPGAAKVLAMSPFDPHSPLKLRIKAIPQMAFWGLGFLARANAKDYAASAVANYRLTEYAVRRIKALREEEGLRYDHAVTGTLKLFRSAGAAAGPTALARMLTAEGLRWEMLDPGQVIAREPALEPIGNQISGALFFPDDEAGDARMFCAELERLITRDGGRVRTGVRAQRLIIEGGRAVGAVTSAGEARADKVVVCTGFAASDLLRTAGIRLPIQPAKGYSVTLKADPETMPHMPVIDDALHAAITPLGDRLRLAGTAEFAGRDTVIRPERIDNLFAMLDAVYPKAAATADRSTAQSWTGFRPMSVDGKPFIGPTRVENLYVNAGHGHLGWTMSMGSAWLLADLVDGRTPETDPEPFRVHR